MKISAFHYNGENYAGNDINNIDQIIKGEDIKQAKVFFKKFCFNKLFNR